jgi:hypothetical protein
LCIGAFFRLIGDPFSLVGVKCVAEISFALIIIQLKQPCFDFELLAERRGLQVDFCGWCFALFREELLVKGNFPQFFGIFHSV